jgi:amino acid transporter
VQTTLRTEAHIDVPWWLIGMVPATAMVLLALTGIRASLRSALGLFAVEVGVVVLLALIVVGHGAGTVSRCIRSVLPPRATAFTG